VIPPPVVASPLADHQLDYAVEVGARIEGWMERDELRWQAIEASRSPLIVVVGAWLGRNVRTLAAAQREAFGHEVGRIFVIDTWKGSAEDPDRDLETGRYPDRGTKRYPSHYLWSVFYRGLSAYIEEGRVIPLRMASMEACGLLCFSSADLVFIDGSHEETAVRDDIFGWLPFVRPGGLLAGHDFFEDGKVCPGVKAAVEKLVPDYRRGPGSIWYWRVLR
jgi:hypothetical protein